MSWNHRLTITISALTALYIIGCSSYSPDSTVIEEKNLAKYNPRNFANKVPVSRHGKAIPQEDEWIMKAIWYEQQNDFKNSNLYYNKLYESTKKKEYLFKELTTALYSNTKTKNISKLQEVVSEKPNNLKAQRLLLSLYLSEKKYEKAKDISKILVAQSSEAVDFELSANPYIYTGNYVKAVELLDEAYKKTFNEDILTKITTIQANYIHDIDAAIRYLEHHRETQECSEKICLQLADVYTQQRKLDKLIPIYKDLYAHTEKEAYAEKLIDAYLYSKNYAPAIEFLKNDYKNNELLYALYIEKKDYLNADELAKKLLIETKDPKWYAESAMALYEGALNKDDKEMLTEVVKRFEQALSAGISNSMYLNYYGYTLIDKDIDVNKGISIIKKAIEKETENTYYIDSLAWGYYKLGNCKQAYPLMQKVIKIEGLDEAELIEHWTAIQGKCKEE